VLDLVFWVLWVVVMYLCSWRLCHCLYVWIIWWFFLFESYSRWMLSKFFLSSPPSVWTWPVLCCICRFNFYRRFCGKLLFLAISCISSRSFLFFSGVNGREFIIEVWYLKAAIVTLVLTYWKPLHQHKHKQNH